MIPEKMLEVLKHEGVVAIVTNGDDGAHIVNTWNSYLNIIDDKRLLVPVGGMKTTESNIKQNNKVLMTMGSREVQGFHSMGTGFLISAEASFISQGTEFDEMKQRFPWVRAIMEIKVESITQTL
jgi:flavin reductase (DIM6/NTAB) family NADH-FMN oxidoreductase RutF